MLSAKNIHKSFKDLHVLKGVNIEVEKAEVVAIIGKSGTGKSTLLHILGTLDNADKGELIIHDQAVFKLSEKALAAFRNKTIGFVFQFHHLLAEFTALENVSIPGYISQNNKLAVERKAKELLEYLGLSDRLEHKPNQLSGGEQQRVAVARALVNEPMVIFADEPSGNLDQATSEELHNLFFQLRDDFKQTFIIATHNNDLAGMSDRRLVLANGILQ